MGLCRRASFKDNSSRWFCWRSDGASSNHHSRPSSQVASIYGLVLASLLRCHCGREERHYNTRGGTGFEKSGYSENNSKCIYIYIYIYMRRFDAFSSQHTIATSKATSIMHTSHMGSCFFFITNDASHNKSLACPSYPSRRRCTRLSFYLSSSSSHHPPV